MRLLLVLIVAGSFAQVAGCGSRPRDPGRKQRAAARRLLSEQRTEQRAEMERLNELIRSSPDDPALYVRRGFAWIDREDSFNAGEQFDRALQMDRRHPGALCGKAAVLLYDESPRQALALLEDLLARVPEYAPAYYWRGQARQLQGEYDLAIEDFDEAIRLNPTYAAAHRARGDAALEKEPADAEAALADLRQAIFFDPHMADAYTTCGDILMDRQEHVRAMRSYERAITIEPAEPYTYTRRGRALAALEKYRDALDDYRLAEELADQSGRWGMEQVMSFDRGVALFHVGEFYEAQMAMRVAIDADSENADAWCYHAECLMETWGNTRDAKDGYGEAITLYERAKQDDDPDYDPSMHARALYGRARAHDEMERGRAAKRDRKEAGQVDPDYEDVDR